MEAVGKITPENGYVVTVDQAIRLDKLGCDCNCNQGYYKMPHGTWQQANWDTCLESTRYYDSIETHHAPTIWQVIDWFETQGIWCWVECEFNRGHIKPEYVAHIAHYRDGKFEIYSDLEGLDETKYQIYEAMIDCALTLLENKREREGK